jgi:hypothetical protein
VVKADRPRRALEVIVNFRWPFLPGLVVIFRSKAGRLKKLHNEDEQDKIGNKVLQV